MNKPARPGRWLPGWLSPKPPVEDDAADYGTAFGLDLSLTEAAPAPPAPAAAEPRPQHLWLRRAGDRRKTGN